jgi:hypothetical protein
MEICPAFRAEKTKPITRILLAQFRNFFMVWITANKFSYLWEFPVLNSSIFKLIANAK